MGVKLTARSKQIVVDTFTGSWRIGQQVTQEGWKLARHGRLQKFSDSAGNRGVGGATLGRVMGWLETWGFAPHAASGQSPRAALRRPRSTPRFAPGFSIWFILSFSFGVP